MVRFYFPCSLCYFDHDSNDDLKSHTRKSVYCFACSICHYIASETMVLPELSNALIFNFYILFFSNL